MCLRRLLDLDGEKQLRSLLYRRELLLLSLMRRTVCQNGELLQHRCLFHHSAQSTCIANKLICKFMLTPFIFYFRSKDFCPAYGCLHEIRALVPQSTPFLLCMATVTRSIQEEVIKSLEMVGCEFVSASPDRCNIFYEVRLRANVKTDMQPLLDSLKEYKIQAPRTIVYCHSLKTCSDLYAHVH